MIARYTTGCPDEQTPARDPLQPRPMSPVAKRFLWIFSVVMVAVAGTAFLFKLIEFTMSFTAGPQIEFAMIPLLTYLMVAAGFACLFAWACVSGHYKDVEAAKYRMLQMQDEFDRAERS